MPALAWFVDWSPRLFSLLPLLFEQTRVDGLGRQSRVAPVTIKQAVGWQYVFVVLEQPVDQKIACDIPQLGVAFAAAEMVPVDDMEDFMGDHAHGLLDAVRLAPGRIEPDAAAVRRHGADIGRVHPCEAECDGADEGCPDEQPGAGLGDDRGKLFHGGLTRTRPACVRGWRRLRRRRSRAALRSCAAAPGHGL